MQTLPKFIINPFLIAVTSLPGYEHWAGDHKYIAQVLGNFCDDPAPTPCSESASTLFHSFILAGIVQHSLFSVHELEERLYDIKDFHKEEGGRNLVANFIAALHELDETYDRLLSHVSLSKSTQQHRGGEHHLCLPDVCYQHLTNEELFALAQAEITLSESMLALAAEFPEQFDFNPENISSIFSKVPEKAVQEKAAIIALFGDVAAASTKPLEPNSTAPLVPAFPHLAAFAQQLVSVCRI